MAYTVTENDEGLMVRESGQADIAVTIGCAQGELKSARYWLGQCESSVELISLHGPYAAGEASRELKKARKKLQSAMKRLVGLSRL